MQYLVYFAVATPLLLGWLFWQTAGVPPPPPMFHSFADTIHDRAVLQHEAEQAWREKQAALARAGAALADAQAKSTRPVQLERTARIENKRNIKLR